MGKRSLALFAFLWVLPASAQDTSALEDEVSRLRARIVMLEEDQEDREVQQASEGGGWRPSVPQATLGGFASTSFQYTNGSERTGSPPDPTQPWSNRENHDEFFLGDLDFFVASQLSERFTFLAEVLLEFEESDVEIDAERLLLRYEHADWLRLAMGRGHAAIGYWNKHRHHGAWLWTTEQRPRLFRFKDEGGPLPIHFVGIEVAGLKDTEYGLIDYNAWVSNGRGSDARRVSIKRDLNDGKTTALALGFSPRSQPGVHIGANLLYDEIAANENALGTPWARHPIYELITGGYVVYQGEALRLMLEGQYIHHGTASKDYDSFGGYAQVSYRLGALSPYYRFDWLSMADDDPYYREYDGGMIDGGIPYVVDLREHTVGVRYDWAYFVALKLEYRRLDSDLENSNTLALQASLAF